MLSTGLHFASESTHAEIAWAIPREILGIDLDEKNGQHGIRDFIAKSGLDPDELLTPRAITPTGGRHLFFHANGATYRNIHLPGLGIELKSAGGSAVLPGAGNGRFWSERAAPLAEVPSFIPTASDRVEALGEAKEFSGETSTYAEAALEYACQAIETAPNGAQEATLNKECYSLGGLVGAGALDKERTIAALTAAALRMPAYEKPWKDLEAKVRHSVEDGARSRERSPVKRRASSENPTA